MKKGISIVLALIFLIGAAPVAAHADCEGTISREVIDYGDGSYLVITTRETVSSSCPSLSSVQTVASIKSTSRAYTFYEEGVAQWTATLNAGFSYDGRTASCTYAGCDVSISNNAWYVASKSADKSGNTASASVTMGKRVLGVTTKTVPITLSLSCDANGNLS